MKQANSCTLSRELLIAYSSAKPAAKQRHTSGNPCDRSSGTSTSDLNSNLWHLSEVHHVRDQSQTEPSFAISVLFHVSDISDLETICGISAAEWWFRKTGCHRVQAPRHILTRVHIVHASSVRHFRARSFVQDTSPAQTLLISVDPLSCRQAGRDQNKKNKKIKKIHVAKPLVNSRCWMTI